MRGMNDSQRMGLVEVKEGNLERVYNIKLEEEYLDVMKGSLGTLLHVQFLKVDANNKPFTLDWNISHETSSPGNSKVNGAAEAAVKTVKGMMKRCLRAREDMYLGLLNIRNTPQEGLNTSPAQRLMGKRMKTLVLTNDTLLKPPKKVLWTKRVG
ncbi:hypothetical protein Hamer_G000644 [Homarus americanus]|uniref:Uncharacterized protein n=1 Tax=Homarus americanus TaxID=6706 RepID=A0A8J5NDJ4_HOMAM|nr:hypothetical protein Hamer_G000644 [Homarus americanus]